MEKVDALIRKDDKKTAFWSKNALVESFGGKYEIRSRVVEKADSRRVGEISTTFRSKAAPTSLPAILRTTSKHILYFAKCKGNILHLW